MSRRLLFTLFAALLLLCAGLSGTARAAVAAVNLVERAAVTAVEPDRCCVQHPSEAHGPAAPQPTVDADGTVELADVPLLPVSTLSLPVCLGAHLLPRPMLLAGHPTPCLDGLLRPPSWRA
jgi:hypothetical protein